MQRGYEDKSTQVTPRGEDKESEEQEKSEEPPQVVEKLDQEVSTLLQMTDMDLILDYKRRSVEKI